MAEVTQLKRIRRPRIKSGKMVSDWRSDAGFGVYPAGADDLHLVQAFSKGLMPVLQNLADPTCCTPSG